MKEYKNILEVVGPLLVVDGVDDATYDEEVEIFVNETDSRVGKVLEVNGSKAVIQLYDSNTGIDPHRARIRFKGKPLSLKVSQEMLGRIFDGNGQVRDNGPALLSYEMRDINGVY